MKKIIAIILTMLISVLLLGCDIQGSKSANNKLGLGIVPFVENNTKDSAQFNAVMAAVVTDQNGKIIDCKIDAIQNTVGIKGGIINEKAYGDEFKTKHQLGNDYGMKEASSINKEWYQQADLFSEYIIGLTAEEVGKIPLGDDKKAKDEVILAGCTIAIDDFIKAVVEGCEEKNMKPFSGENFKLGISAYSTYDKTSKNADAANKGLVKLESVVCAVVTNEEKEIFSSMLDVVEAEIEFDSTGTVLTPKENIIFTKRDMGYDYGMKKVSQIGKEWFEQATAFEEYIVGLDGVGVNSMKTVVNTENGKILTDEPELKAGCTIAVDGFMKACYNAVESIK